MRAVVLGSTGYVGMMLMRILASHPEVNAITPVSRSQAGSRVRESDPGLGPAVDALLERSGGRFVDITDSAADSADVIFSALPHGAAAELVGEYVGTVPVIDLSADFRITNRQRYETVYKTTHPYPDLLSRAVYGLCEWSREAIAGAALIACPGCYPTATLLPLLPFVSSANGPAVKRPVIVNALSGISGAGRKEAVDYLFNERAENLNAYAPGRVHRHVPEIEQELDRSADGTPSATPVANTPWMLFTPHLVPAKQGMIVTAVIELEEELSQSDAEARLREAYADSPFVGLSPRGIPQSRDVRNTNRCDLGVKVHGRHVQLFSALDNLYKGASGQAVQNMNIRFGFPESAGLRAHGEF